MPMSMMKKWFYDLVFLSICAAGFVGHAAACDRSALLRQVMSGMAAPSARPASRSALPMALAQAAAAQPASAKDGKGSASIVGLWDVTFYVDGQAVGESFDAWNLGGTEVLTDGTNPIEDNVCIGTWQQTGRRTYKLFHPSFFFDDSGNLLGTAILRDTVTLSRDGNSYTGAETVDAYDPAGNFLGHSTDTFTGTRLKVDF